MVARGAAHRVTRSRGVRRVTVLVALLPWIASPGAGAVDAAELRVGIGRLPAVLDPASITSGPELALYRLLFQGLVEVGERGEIEPALATQWMVSRDGLTWTFRLRPGVQLSSGAPLTPDDVVSSLARHLSPGEPGEGSPPWARLFRGAARLVREIRRGEGGTVQVVLGQPFSPILALLAHPAFAVGAVPADPEARLSGTGPYRVAEQAPGRLVLAAAPTGRDDGRPRRIVFTEVADDAAGIAGLAPGAGLDLYFAQAPPAWAGLGLQTLSAPTWQVGLLAFRTDRGATSRKAVRQAIALSLDPALVHPALSRSALPFSSYLPPGTWSARELAAPPHDPGRARRLLGQAGAVDAALTVLAPEATAGPPDGPDLPRLADAVRLSLATAGLKVGVRVEPAETILRAMRQGEGDLALVEAELQVNDPHFFLQPLLASDGAPPGSGTNVAYFRSPLVDGMLFRASQLAFRPERLRLYQRLQAFVAEELPYLPLYVRLRWVVARPGVRGLRLEPGGFARLERVSVGGRPATP